MDNIAKVTKKNKKQNLFCWTKAIIVLVQSINTECFIFFSELRPDNYTFCKREELVGQVIKHIPTNTQQHFKMKHSWN